MTDRDSLTVTHSLARSPYLKSHVLRRPCMALGLTLMCCQHATLNANVPSARKLNVRYQISMMRGSFALPVLLIKLRSHFLICPLCLLCSFARASSIAS